MSSTVHIGNKKKDILIFGKGQTQRLDNTALYAKARYSINSSGTKRKLCLSLHYNMSNNFLVVCATKI